MSNNNKHKKQQRNIPRLVVAQQLCTGTVRMSKSWWWHRFVDCGHGFARHSSTWLLICKTQALDLSTGFARLKHMICKTQALDLWIIDLQKLVAQICGLWPWICKTLKHMVTTQQHTR
jgi:hypothetical protein